MKDSKRSQITSELQPGDEFWPRDRFFPKSAVIPNHPNGWNRFWCWLTFGHRWRTYYQVGHNENGSPKYDCCDKCLKFRKKPSSPDQMIQDICMKAFTEGRVVTGNINRKGQTEYD